MKHWIKSMYNRIDSSRYIMSPLSLFQYSYINKKWIYTGIKKHRDYITGDVLDFWCGKKPYQSLFNYHTYTWVDVEVSGHDNSLHKIDVYRDGKRLPFEDNSFDSIIAIEVFEHIFNLDEVLYELHRVLKPWGHLLSTTPFFIHEHEQPYDFARYSSFWLKHLYTIHDFTVIHADQYGNYGEVILQLIIRYWWKVLTTRNTILTVLIRIVFGIPIILIWNLLSFLTLPVKQWWYLNNVFLVKK